MYGNDPFTGGIGRTYRHISSGSTDCADSMDRLWPTSWDGMVEEYDRRERVYLGMSYDRRERVDFSMFEARNAEDDIIMVARRMMRDVSYIIEVDAAAIATNGVKLTTRSDVDLDPDRASELLDVANRIWRRSNVARNLPSWALRGCDLGKWHWEAQAHPETGDAHIIGHDPRMMRTRSDAFGKVVRSLQVYQYRDDDDDTLDETGDLPRTPSATTMKRQITADEYVVFKGKARDEETSGKNRLGVVPVTTWCFRDLGRPMPGWAGQGFEPGMAAVDSALTQIAAVGTRKANSIMVGKGVDVGGGSDVSNLDAAISVPENADVKYLEPLLQGLSTLLDQVDSMATKLRATAPEFMFTEASSASSGLALSNRASAFVAKIEPIRQSFYEALALVTSYAVAIELGEAWTEDLDVFVVDGGEALPLDVEAMATLYLTLVDANLMKPVDAVEKLQALGLLPDADPIVYLTELQEAQRAQNVSEAADVAQEVLARQGITAEQPVPTPVDEGEVIAEADDVG